MFLNTCDVDDDVAIAIIFYTSKAVSILSLTNLCTTSETTHKDNRKHFYA